MTGMQQWHHALKEQLGSGNQESSSCAVQKVKVKGAETVTDLEMIEGNALLRFGKLIPVTAFYNCTFGFKNLSCD